MKAVVFEAPGEPESVLSVQEVPETEPPGGFVRVRMLACPVNPSDLLYIRGRYTLPPECPATPGFEGVGVVEAAGSGMRARMMLGKRVAVLSRRGGNWAEQNVVPAAQVIPFSNLLTGSLTIEQSATFFVNPATAYVMTRKVLDVPAGAWLLQTAAASVLGRMIIRLGQRFGFRTMCVVRRESQVEELRDAGADAVICFDPATQPVEDLEAAVRNSTGASPEETGIHYALDCVGGATGSAVVRCLDKNARMLVFGTLSGEPLEFSPRTLMKPGATIEGFWLGNYMDQLKLAAKLNLVRKIAGLIREDVLTSEIATTYPLDEITAAVREAEAPGHRGKVLLRIAAE